MILTQAYDWTFPVPIAYGPGRIRELDTFCRNVGIRRPLVVTDHGSRDLPFIAQAMKFLDAAGLQPGLFAGISPNPREDEICNGREAFKSGGHDAVVAIGGGSGLDGGKSLSLVANNNRPLWDFDAEDPVPDMRGEAPFPPLICVPTTSGTGAETESTGMVTDTAQRTKRCVWHPDARLALALLDPGLTVALPRNLTAWTGVDALVHALEAYCVPDFHPLCDGAAIEALRLIRANLSTAVTEPGNLAARGGMMVGSCLAGVSFLKGLGLEHALQHGR